MTTSLQELCEQPKNSIPLYTPKPDVLYAPPLNEQDPNGIHIRTVGNALFCQGRELTETDYDPVLWQLVDTVSSYTRVTDLALNDEAFRVCTRGFVERCAEYTIATTKIIDIAGKGNAFFHKDGESYEAKLIDPLLNRDIKGLHNTFLAGENDAYLTLLTNYIRQINALALVSGISPPFDIRCPNLDATKEPITHLDWEDWKTLQTHLYAGVEEAIGTNPQQHIKPSHHPSAFSISQD